MAFGSIRSRGYFPEKMSASPRRSGNRLLSIFAASMISASNGRADVIRAIPLISSHPAPNAARVPRLPWSESLPHFLRAWQSLPLCLHRLTNTSRCIQPDFTSVSKYPGHTPFSASKCSAIPDLRALNLEIRAARPERQSTESSPRRRLDPSGNARLQCVVPHD
jgi:hypothetical protein